MTFSAAAKAGSTMAEDQLKQAVGWAEFLSNKSEILDEYFVAKDRNVNRPVKVDHGVVAEASVRKWLSGFLPKKYAVTSGYILSQGSKQNEKLRHYDVIIYDCLEAPTLWIESSADSSEGGNKRAIPAEHVLCVLEVKATLNKNSVLSATEKLRELLPLGAEIDADDERYKTYLHKNFCAGIVFMEIHKDERKKYLSYVNAVVDLAAELRGFSEWSSFQQRALIRGQRVLSICLRRKMLKKNFMGRAGLCPRENPFKMNQG